LLVGARRERNFSRRMASNPHPALRATSLRAASLTHCVRAFDVAQADGLQAQPLTPAGEGVSAYLLRSTVDARLLAMLDDQLHRFAATKAVDRQLKHRVDFCWRRLPGPAAEVDGVKHRAAGFGQ